MQAIRRLLRIGRLRKSPHQARDKLRDLAKQSPRSNLIIAHLSSRLGAPTKFHLYFIFQKDSKLHGLAATKRVNLDNFRKLLFTLQAFVFRACAAKGSFMICFQLCCVLLMLLTFDNLAIKRSQPQRVFDSLGMEARRAENRVVSKRLVICLYSRYARSCAKVLLARCLSQSKYYNPQ